MRTNNCLFDRSHSIKDKNEVPLDQERNAKELSTQRLEDFFANEDFKFSSPASWGRTSISPATKNVQAQIQAFDQAFMTTRGSGANKQENVENLGKR